MVFRGSGGILPRKVFENLDAMKAILVVSEQFLWKIFCNFFAP